jgi:hypothetical protein
VLYGGQMKELLIKALGSKKGIEYLEAAKQKTRSGFPKQKKLLQHV